MIIHAGAMIVNEKLEKSGTYKYKKEIVPVSVGSVYEWVGMWSGSGSDCWVIW